MGCAARESRASFFVRTQQLFRAVRKQGKSPKRHDFLDVKFRNVITFLELPMLFLFKVTENFVSLQAN